VLQTKQIGYYSDMVKLEFALPKFAMYKRILAKILAERFVIERASFPCQATKCTDELDQRRDPPRRHGTSDR